MRFIKSMLFFLFVGILFFGNGETQALDKKVWLSLPPYQWKSENVELARAWEEMMGFKASEAVGKAAPEIKPGMIIDGSNYKDYPGLKKLLSPGLWLRMDPSSYAPLGPLKIGETDQYHWSEGCRKKSVENTGSCRIGGDGISLEGYKGGIPFIHPRKGIESAWNRDNKYMGDTFEVSQFWMRLYGRNNRPERSLKQTVWHVRWSNRCDWGEDVKPNPEGISYILSAHLFYPRDISGNAWVRRRFLDPEKPDEFLLYIPSMRRVRRMSGLDSQDPSFGSDVTWDDYELYYQKISSNTFPVKWNIVKETESLLPTNIGKERPSGYYVDESTGKACLYYGSWQRRPTRILEGIELDKSYMYSRRVLVVDREFLGCSQTDLYDQKGRLWRSIVRDLSIDPVTGYYMDDLFDEIDCINYHRTIVEFVGIRNPEWMGTEYGDLKFLINKSR